MIRYLIVSISSGIAFGIADGIIQANPLARNLMSVYRPIAKTSVNAPVGTMIDIAYGFILGFLFILLYNALPGNSGLLKGLGFGLILWFLRVVMSVVSTWMMYTVPTATLLYIAAAGLVEMLMIGMIYGIFLKPFHL